MQGQLRLSRAGPRPRGAARERQAKRGTMTPLGVVKTQRVQEIALEDLLRASFPFDAITEVGKGVRGADCIQTVRNNFGQECGKIIYESKRTTTFSPGTSWPTTRPSRNTAKSCASPRDVAASQA